MKKQFIPLVKFATILVLTLASGLCRAADDWTVEKLVDLYEQSWTDINSVRVEFAREVRTLAANDAYDNCLWERFGAKAHVVESQAERRDQQDRKGEKKGKGPAKIRTECYFDGEKTYELDMPFALYPLTNVEFGDYASLKRLGVRASISNRNKHWRFFFFAPIPRYFSLPSEPELVTLRQATQKYQTRIHKVLASDSGDPIYVLQIREDVVEGAASNVFASWRLYVSLDMRYRGAISAYQLVVETKREPKTTVITECKVNGFAERFGVWVPTALEYCEHAGERSCITQIRVKDVAFNLPENELQPLTFPENLVVSESIWEEGQVKPNQMVLLWGANGQPAREYDSLEDFEEEYYKEFPQEKDEKNEPGNRRSFKIVAFLAVCALVVIALAFSLHDGEKSRAKRLERQRRREQERDEEQEESAPED
ncbi:MAG: hypothetical protein Q4G03_02635 [Planctomycetia bacterium]|nr:hypothetical protein [Planctomycetia bacterium]